MAGFRPPILAAVQARFYPSSTPLQKRLYKFMRPLDQPVNVYVWSDGTVTTDYVVPIAATSENGEATSSTVKVQVPWTQSEGGVLPGGNQGAEGGPYVQPPPYATVSTWQAANDRINQLAYSFNPWVEFWFRGGCTYPSISASLATILTNAGFAGYLI